MKTKILFLVVLLALAPPFSTFSYGQAALRGREFNKQVQNYEMFL